MTRLRYVPKTGKKNARGVVEMTVAPDRNAPCKECGKEPRLHGSSRGQRCKDAYAAQKTKESISDDRLARKIAEQSKK